MIQSALHTAITVPGWFGKLPGMGDFAHRRLSPAFRDRWDGWLQAGLSSLRAGYADWEACYLEAPLWYFALGPGSVDAGAWLGVLVPSVDAVGRCFPLTLAMPFAAATGAGENPHGWWQRAAQAGVDALNDDLDASAFDELLARRFGPCAPPVRPAAEAVVEEPPRGQSLWRTAALEYLSQALTLPGLPLGERFDALFGCLPRPWSENA